MKQAILYENFVYKYLSVKKVSISPKVLCLYHIFTTQMEAAYTWDTGNHGDMGSL